MTQRTHGATYAPPTAPVLLHALHPINLLSFGPDTPEILLQSLNLLIGPNGSGKSNLLATIDLLRSSPIGIAGVMRRGGGVSEWIWKGKTDKPAQMDAVMDYPQSHLSLRHMVQFVPQQQSFQLIEEHIDTTPQA